MKKTLLKTLPMLLVGLLFAVQSFAQTNYYVNASALDDTGDGLSTITAKKTIQAAINAASAGDIINLANGTYLPSGAVSSQFININKSLTIKGASKTGTIIDGDFDGLGGSVGNYNTAGGFGFRIAANNVILQDFTATNFETGIGCGIGVSGLTITNVAANENYRYGFYTNQSIEGLTISNSEFRYNGNKGGSSAGSSARGIMLQSTAANHINININNNDISFNQLVGVDFAGSNLTDGINIANNTVEGNGDSGIGLWLGKNAVSSKAVLVSANIITMLNNSRFGIEIKNAVGTGANTGVGSVVVANNNISQSGTPTNSRDFAAIAVLRRKDGYTNINDQCFGVYLSGNTITGIKGSAAAEGDGFGIVLGGTGHTVIGNNISNTEIAIQLQKGNIDYNTSVNSPSNPGDANTLYFDRDNSADACAYIGTNTLSTTVADYRYVTGAATFVTTFPELVAKNNNTLVQFCSIQSAIDAPSTVTGDIVDVFVGTHTLTTGIVVNKSISLRGNGGLPNVKPLITGGDVTNKALIYVSAPNVTISNLHLRFQESSFTGTTTTTTAGYGIKSGATGSFNNLTIADNLIEGTNSTYVFNSAAIFLGVLNTNGNDNVTITGNTVGHTIANNALGRAVRAFNINGNINNNNFKAHYATLQVGDPSGGALIVDNNTLQGKLAMNGYVSPGNKITNNIITSGGTADANGATGADRQPALIEVISTTVPAATVEVSGNTLNDFKILGIAVFYSSNVSVINNTLNPLSGSSNTIGLYFDTKTTNTGTPGARSFSNLIVKQNKFNVPVPLGSGHIGIKFANSYADALLAPLTGAIIGGDNAEANIFSSDLSEYIHLDNRPVGTKTTTNGDPLWTSGYYSGTADTDIRPFSSNIVAEMNVYGTIDTRTDRTLASFSLVKTKIYDKDDVVGLGEVILNFPVRNLTTQLGYLTIQSAIDAATANDVLKVDEGTYAEKITINKKLTINGPNVGVAGVGTRVAEAKIIPPATDIGASPTDMISFVAGSTGSVFDGFEVNGNNPSQVSGVVSGGEDIDASLGIGLKDVGNIIIKNNIVQNFGSSLAVPVALGIYAEPTTNAVYSGIVIEYNYVKNIYQSAASAALVGIYTYSNAYAQIKNNKVENVRTGIQFDNPNQVNPNAATFEAAIDDNEIIAARGIYYNLAYNTASPWYVRRNTIKSAPLIAPSSTFIGIRIESIQGAYSGYITDNVIDGQHSSRISENVAFVGTGLWFNNKVNTTGTLLFKDNEIANVTDGIVYNATGTETLITKVRFAGGEIRDVQRDYVRYVIPSGTPTFADINLPSTQLDGKTGEEWDALGQLADVYNKITDKDENAAFGKVNLLFNVKNLTQGTAFATIQDAIDDVLTVNADVIDVKEGTYTLATGVVINKELTLQGNSNLATKPIINGVGNSTNKALFEVNSPNVTIKNFEFQIAQQGDALVGVSSTTTDNFNNLSVEDNLFKGMKGYATGYVWASYAMKLGRGSAGVVGGVLNNKINVVRNTVSYNTPSTPELFGRGIYAFNTYGKIGGSISDKNTVTAVYALQGGELGGGASNTDFEFSHNDVPLGLVSVVGAEVGSHKINNNNIGSAIPNLTTAQGIVRMLEVKGSRTAGANIEVAANVIEKYGQVGIFIQRSNNVTVKGNTLTPFTGVTAFNSIVFSSKEGTSATQSPVTSENLTITSNTLNGTGGTGIAFWNHNGSSSIKPLVNAVIGGTAVDANTFSASLGNYISLDATASGDTENATMGTLYDVTQNLTNKTNIFPFTGDVNASSNIFGSVNTNTSTNFADLLAVKAKITDGIDNALTGYVNIQPNKAFVGVSTNLDNALSVVPDNFTLLLENNSALYQSMGNRTITKAHTFDIDANTADEITFGNLTVNAVLKEVNFTDAAKVNGSFTLTAGKITPASTFTLNGSLTTTPGLANFINGAVTVNNINSDVVIPVGKGVKAAYVALTGATGTGSVTAEYFPVSYSSLVKDALLGSVSNKEYWSLAQTGTLNAKLKLSSFDLALSGLFTGTLQDAVIARYDNAQSKWVTLGNSAYFAGTENHVTANTAVTDFGFFTFGSNTAVLPVKLTSFTAHAATGGALVKWSTASEENNATFEIEKSFDGKSFFTIDSRKGQGNSTTATSYEFLDLNFKQSAYYRLVQVDAGGKRTTYTDLTKFVKGFDNNLSVVAYPNPVTTKLYVNVGSTVKETVKVLLTDLTGKTLKVKVADSTQPIELDVVGVATGSYILQVIKASGNVSKKILKL